MDTSKGLFRRALDGMIAARRRSAQRHIDSYFETHPDRRWRDQVSGK